MGASIRELKRRYTIGVATHRVYPTSDRGIPMPLSTGVPVFDAALTDALVATTELTETEHVARAWKLVREASDEEVAVLGANAQRLLHDYKMLLALRCWERGDEAGAQTFLGVMPWGRRLAFPLLAVRPATHLFTGWRRSIRFRLIGDPRFEALRELYRLILAGAPPAAILKYRATIQQVAALLHYRFDGERERLIHDWCFSNGASLAGAADMEPISTYVRARAALSASGAEAMVRVLADSPANVSVTSVMGLIGSAGVRLTDSGTAAAAMRDYVVRCCTAIEALLRLTEWDAWLKKSHAETIGTHVRSAVHDDGAGVPFHRVLRAFDTAPDRARRLTAVPMLLPVLQAFGRRAAALLGPPGPVTAVQLGNVPHATTLTVAASLASATETRLVMVNRNSAAEVPPPVLEEVASRLADNRHKFDQWLLDLYADGDRQYGYHYDPTRLNAILASLNPEAPVLLDVPAWRDARLLTTLMPFTRVFSMQGALGAPGEISVRAVCHRSRGMRRSSGRSMFSGYTDGAAAGLAEVIEAIDSFAVLADAADSMGVDGP